MDDATIDFRAGTFLVSILLQAIHIFSVVSGFIRVCFPKASQTGKQFLSFLALSVLAEILLLYTIVAEE